MKIAIIKLSALGDIVHAMVALQFIREAYPEAEIDWIVEQGFAPVLTDNPDIRHVLPVNLKALKTNKSLLLSELAKIRTYAQEHYDFVIDAQGLIKSALVARGLSAQCTGFDRHSIRESLAACCYRHHVACPYDANTIDRNVKVLTQPLGVTVTRDQIMAKKPFLFYQQPEQTLDDCLSPDQPNVLYVIGSTWPSRNYPKQQFAQVIQGLEANHLILWGNAQELQDAEWIATCTQARVLPKLSLNDLKAVISQADLIIGNDTGPTHMAWGLNRPSITLFGPTPVSRVYQTPINQVLKSPSKVNPFKLDKNDFSIGEITAESIIQLARSLLQTH